MKMKTLHQVSNVICFGSQSNAQTILLLIIIKHGQGLNQWLLKPAHSSTLMHYHFIQYHQRILAIYMKL